MVRELTVSPPRRKSLEALLDGHAGDANLDLESPEPVDGSRWFVCPTLTPLYYTPLYRELSNAQQRRYNQLTAMGFNELIAFFEGTFASSVLRALSGTGQEQLPAVWTSCLRRFLDDERQHIGWWRKLNRLSDPNLYAAGDSQIIRISPVLRRLLNYITSRPHRFPVVFWIMLALEERSLDISRRCMKMNRHEIESRYRRTYQQHLVDESRHVQMDWHLIERFYAHRTLRVRRLNARLFCYMTGRFFLPPTRSAVRVARRLAAEHAELKTMLPAMIRQLGRLHRDSDYQHMMYSRSTTPITFSLFDRFEEMHAVRHVLQSYEPLLAGTKHGND